MKKTFTLMALVFCLSANAAELEGNPAPAFAVDALGGGKLELSQLKGKVIYLDFWASWCGPCKKSFPWMQEMQKKYGAQGFQVIAINVDQAPEDRDGFIKKLGFTPTFSIGLDPEGKLAETYHVKGMPSSYLIDKKGVLKLEHPGFRDENINKVEEAIKASLGSN